MTTARPRPTAPVLREELGIQLEVTLRELRRARAAWPEHEVMPEDRHYGCDICIAEQRLNRLLDKLPRRRARQWPQKETT